MSLVARINCNISGYLSFFNADYVNCAEVAACAADDAGDLREHADPVVYLYADCYAVTRAWNAHRIKCLS
jgi:hypothetical protein